MKKVISMIVDKSANTVFFKVAEDTHIGFPLSLTARSMDDFIEAFELSLKRGTTYATSNDKEVAANTSDEAVTTEF